VGNERRALLPSGALLELRISDARTHARAATCERIMHTRKTVYRSCILMARCEHFPPSLSKERGRDSCSLNIPYLCPPRFPIHTRDNTIARIPVSTNFGIYNRYCEYRMPSRRYGIPNKSQVLLLLCSKKLRHKYEIPIYVNSNLISHACTHACPRT